MKPKYFDLDATQGHGCRLAGWVVEDVIGFWAGGPGIETVKKASEGAGVSDTILVEIDVATVPVGPDSESRSGIAVALLYPTTATCG